MSHSMFSVTPPGTMLSPDVNHLRFIKCILLHTNTLQIRNDLFHKQSCIFSLFNIKPFIKFNTNNVKQNKL